MPATFLRYDRAHRRVWILGQRCHHGATGALVAGLGMGRRSLLLATAGGVLMAHDWPDRSLWFARGRQDQAEPGSRPTLNSASRSWRE
jgi:bifunctional N-acetylglucosamine-1-phosphate-uridyltransferase/glucosamine-1-phosphate-acetyltransferase GlmU-like protein